MTPLISWTAESSPRLQVGSFTCHPAGSPHLSWGKGGTVVKKLQPRPNSHSFTILAPPFIIHLEATSSKHCRSHHMRTAPVCNRDVQDERRRSLLRLWAVSGPRRFSGLDTGRACQTLAEHAAGRPSISYSCYYLSKWKHACPRWATNGYSPSTCASGPEAQTNQVPWCCTVTTWSCALFMLQVSPSVWKARATSPTIPSTQPMCHKLLMIWFPNALSTTVKYFP